MFGAGMILIFSHITPPNESMPKLVTAYTDGVLSKNNQIYTFTFQYTTVDSFVERNPIDVKVNAILPGVTSECVKIRFAGAANYSGIFHGPPVNIPNHPNVSIFCHQNLANEMVLFRQTDTYQNNETLSLQYGMNGNWGVWYFNPRANQTYADYVPDVIHISPYDTLVQLQTNRLQNYFNTLILSLTFVIAGATMITLTTKLYPKKKTRLNDVERMSESQSFFSEKTVISIALVVLMIITGIVIIVSFLTLNEYSVQVVENGVVHNESRYYLSINKESWKQLESNNLLLGILTASAAIVAISFTIIQMLTTDLEGKYGSYAKSFLIIKPNIPFLSLILVMAGSSMMLFILHSLDPVVSLFLILALLEGFIFSLILYVQNYYDLFRLNNPFAIIDEIRNRITQNMTEQDDGE